MKFKAGIFVLFITLQAFAVALTVYASDYRCRGDVNRDGIVDTADWPAFRDNFFDPNLDPCPEPIVRVSIYSADEDVTDLARILGEMYGVPCEITEITIFQPPEANLHISFIPSLDDNKLIVLRLEGYTVVLQLDVQGD